MRAGEGAEGARGRKDAETGCNPLGDKGIAGELASLRKFVNLRLARGCTSLHKLGLFGLHQRAERERRISRITRSD
jgi:hypothetical protein